MATRSALPDRGLSMFLVAVLSVTPALSEAPQAAVSQDAVRRIDSTLRAEAANGFSGSVLVASGDKVLIDAGYGALRGAPVDKGARFWIASTAKQFVSAAILKCQERGLLTLDDPLAKVLADVPAEKRGITIRQLLSHTSGFGQSYVSEGQDSRATAVELMLAEPLVQAPGAGFKYANNNLQLAVAIVEVASGLAYADFARRELWRPAGMTATGFAGDPGAKRVAAAVGDLPPRLRTSSWGGEGVYSTTGDLFRWYRSLNGGVVLSRRSVEQLFAPVAPISEGQTALAWFRGLSPGGRPPIFTRGNEDFGPNSLVYAYPDRDIVIIVLSHAGNVPDGEAPWSRFLLAKIQGILSL